MNNRVWIFCFESLMNQVKTSYAKLFEFEILKYCFTIVMNYFDPNLKFSILVLKHNERQTKHVDDLARQQHMSTQFAQQLSDKWTCIFANNSGNCGKCW